MKKHSISIQIGKRQLLNLFCASLFWAFAGPVRAVENSLTPTQSATRAHSYQVQVVRDQAEIFRDPHFDSEVIGQVPEGQKFFSSSKKFNNTFYKILISKGQLGYIADSDVRKLWNDSEENKSQGKKSEETKLEQKKTEGKKTDKKNKSEGKTNKPKADEKKRKVFSNSNFVGISYSSLEYKENTMGDHRRATIGFFGLKVSGPDLLVDGPMPTELNILFYPGAPNYYEQVTGKSASGWILIMDGIWQNYYPLSREAFGIFGFGPLFKFAKYNLGLQDRSTGQTSYYASEDISLGMVFSVGGAIRVGSLALRGEYSYFWEKEAYGGFSFSLQKDF